MKITEELDEYRASQEKILLVAKETEAAIRQRLDELEAAGSRPQLVFDTLIEQVADANGIGRRDAMKAIQRAVDNSGGIITNDGTVVRYRNQLVRCPQCGARYSDVLRSCPGHRAHTRA